MENEFTIRISCGKHLGASMISAVGRGERVDKTVKLSGDISLEDVRRIASNLALSTYQEKQKKLDELKSGVMPDGIANAFIYDYDELVSAVSIDLEGKEPSVTILGSEEISKFYEPVSSPRFGR